MLRNLFCDHLKLLSDDFRPQLNTQLKGMTTQINLDDGT